MAKKPNKVALLEAALKAAEDIIGHYEEESERSCYDEEDVSKDLRELEQELEKAKERLSSLAAERREKVE